MDIVERLRFPLSQVPIEDTGDADAALWERIVAEREEAAAEITRLRELVRVKDEALEVFARMAENYEPDEADGHQRAWDNDVKMGDLRKARAAWGMK